MIVNCLLLILVAHFRVGGLVSYMSSKMEFVFQLVLASIIRFLKAAIIRLLKAAIIRFLKSSIIRFLKAAIIRFLKTSIIPFLKASIIRFLKFFILMISSIIIVYEISSKLESALEPTYLTNLVTVGKVALGAAVAVGGATEALRALGFCAAGVAAGSTAAAIHGTIGNVAAGSIFAAMQSAGAAGMAVETKAALAVVGGFIASFF